MAAESFSWIEVLNAIIQNPDKGALVLVLLVGAWRWLREVWREAKDDSHHETLLETLLRENKELREELRIMREKRNDND